MSEPWDISVPCCAFVAVLPQLVSLVDGRSYLTGYFHFCPLYISSHRCRTHEVGTRGYEARNGHKHIFTEKYNERQRLQLLQFGSLPYNSGSYISAGLIFKLNFHLYHKNQRLKSASVRGEQTRTTSVNQTFFLSQFWTSRVCWLPTGKHIAQGQWIPYFDMNAPQIHSRGVKLWKV